MSIQERTGPIASLRMAASTVVAAVISSVYLVGAARVLGPREFSDLAVCLSLTYVALLFLGPLNLTLIRFSSLYRIGNDASQIRPLLRTTARVYAPWVVGVLVVSLVMASAIAPVLHVGSAALIPWIGALAALGLAVGAVRAVDLGLSEYGWYSGSVLLDAVVRLAIGGALALTWRSAGAALAGFAVGNAAVLAIYGVRTWRRLPRSSKTWTESDEVLRFMARALAFSAVVALLQNIDMIVAKLRLDAVEAGDYAVALAIARGFLLLASPFVGDALARDEGLAKTGLARLLHMPAVLYAGVSAAGLALLFAAPAAILSLLYGRSTAPQAQLLPLLSAGYAVGGVFVILAQREIRVGRFGFLAPVAVTLGAAAVAMMAISPSAVSIGWIVFAAHSASVIVTLGTPVLLARLRPFDTLERP
jgi:O-antigen/teichoic acid export membrane protein